jgi:predicted dehydrogenase
MADRVNIGLIGLGGMGRLHYNCYRNNAHSKIVALCDIVPSKARGCWEAVELNLGSEGSDETDMAGIASYTAYADLIADPNVQVVDICLPTHLHAEVAIAALKAGKDVLCEKPMALNEGECAALEEVVQETGRRLQVGHCLRYWPQYLAAEKIIRSGEYGDWRYARFERFSGAPKWSWDNWLLTQPRSGGVVLDMHIHDADAALWWFGRPETIHADGALEDGLAVTVDAAWRYPGGKIATLHSGWDLNGGPFHYAFRVVMEKATVAFDSNTGSSNLQIYADGQQTEIPVEDASAYQLEIDDFIARIQAGKPVERVTPASSRAAVAAVREEIRQIEAARK